MKIPNRSIPLILMIILAFAPPLAAHKARNNASVFIENLHDGAVITSPVHVSFGAQHIEIAPVGVNIHRAGHHHLLINVDTPESMDVVIPFDPNHRHYMNGETEAVIELPPGEHTLQLVLGDEEHLPWAEHLVSERITIKVVSDVGAPH
jgi:hypothetical protein